MRRPEKKQVAQTRRGRVMNASSRFLLRVQTGEQIAVREREHVDEFMTLIEEGRVPGLGTADLKRYKARRREDDEGWYISHASIAYDEMFTHFVRIGAGQRDDRGPEVYAQTKPENLHVFKAWLKDHPEYWDINVRIDDHHDNRVFRGGVEEYMKTSVAARLRTGRVNKLKKRIASMKTKRGSYVRVGANEARKGTVYWSDPEVKDEMEMVLEVEIEKGDPGSPGEYPPGYDSALIISGKFEDGEGIPQDVLEAIEQDAMFQERALEELPEYTKDDWLTDRADSLHSG